MGRPTKLTPWVRERILAAIAGGNTLKDAAAAAGIGYSTLEHWLADPRPRYQQFRQAVEQKQAEAVLRRVAIIEKAAEEQWQAAAWWLERRRPDEWGRQERVRAEVRHHGQMEVTHDHGQLTAFLGPIAALVDDYLARHAPADGAGQSVDSGDADAEASAVPGAPGA